MGSLHWLPIVPVIPPPVQSVFHPHWALACSYFKPMLMLFCVPKEHAPKLHALLQLLPSLFTFHKSLKIVSLRKIFLNGIFKKIKKIKII